MNNKQCIAAADIGGTKIRFGLFDQNLNCIHRLQLPSDAKSGAAQLIQVLTQGLEQLKAHSQTLGLELTNVGVSSAGVIDSKSGTVIDATDAIPNWIGTKISELVSTHFKVPCAVENDVNAALVGELSALATKPEGAVVMLTLGTGLGGAIASKGVLHTGTHHLAGHFGRMPMPSPWRKNSFVTLEELVSGSGLVNIANQLAGSEFYQSGEQVLVDVQDERVVATQALTQFCDYLAMAIEQVYWAIDPEIIILGGGLIEAKDAWWSQFQARLKARSVKVSVLNANLENDAGMVGAAILANKSKECVDV